MHLIKYYFKYGFIVFGFFIFIVGLSLSFAQAQSLILEDNFEDGNYNLRDASLAGGGISWTAEGSVVVRTSSPWPTRLVALSIGSSLVSNQLISLDDFTLNFDAINWYNTPTRVLFNYLDNNNYYYFSPTSGAVGRVLNGVEEEFTDKDYRRYLIMSRSNPAMYNFKIHFKRSTNAILIEVDKNGYNNGVDYEFSFLDTNPEACRKFVSGGRIKFVELGSGSYSYWANYDNIKIYQGKLESAIPRSPTIIYVSTSGNDSNPGTEARPVATIAKALDLSLPGDTILVKSGVYNESIVFRYWDKVYATKDRRLIIKSESPAAQTRLGAKVQGIDLSPVKFVTVDGFEVEGGSIIAGGASEAGVYYESEGTEILNNYVHHVRTIGIVARGENIRVAGNYLYHIAMGITTVGKNNIIENNEIERLVYPGYGDSDYTRFSGEGHIIRNNYMHGTRQEEIGPAHVDGFQTFDNNGEYARNILFEGNFIEDFYAQGCMCSSVYYYHSYNFTFRNNIFKDAGAFGLAIEAIRDVKVYNNIFINASIHGVSFQASRNDANNISTGEVFNNIFYNGGSLYWGTYNASGNNIIFSAKGNYNASAYPRDIVNKDPLFMNVQTKDFKLHPASPAIDAGAVLYPSFPDREGTLRPQGAGWDIGPYEEIKPQAPVAFINLKDNFGMLSFEGYQPYTIHFDGSSSYAPSGVNLTEYRWNFGDGTPEALGAKVDHIFNSSGNFTVRLTVRDSQNRTHSMERYINILASKYPNLYLRLALDGELKDSSGKNMNTSWIGTPSYGQGVFGQAAQFDQSVSRGIRVDRFSQYMPQHDYLDGVDEFTFAFWAKKNNPSQEERVIHKHTVYTLYLTRNGFLFSFNNEAGQSGSASVNNLTLDNNWHHYAVTYNGQNIKLYFDGKEVANNAFSGRMRRNRIYEIVIGRDPWGASLDGLMDEIRFYDRPLSKDEINYLMANNKLPQDETNFLLGDVSGDGRISSYDAALVAQHVVGLITLTPEQILRADVSGDGNISSYDASLILSRVVAG